MQRKEPEESHHKMAPRLENLSISLEMSAKFPFFRVLSYRLQHKTMNGKATVGVKQRSNARYAFERSLTAFISNAST